MRGKIGIAGYAGSGKSTVARLLADSLSVRVIDADREAKQFIAGNSAVVEELIAAFGPSIANRGVLDFRTLGAIVFSSAEQLLKYNAIVHPPLLLELRRLIEGPAAVILDAALIPLWNITPWFDACVWVHAGFETRMARIGANRNDLDERKIETRLRLQETIMKEPAGTPWVRIGNDGRIEELEHSVITLKNEFN